MWSRPVEGKGRMLCGRNSRNRVTNIEGRRV